MSKPPSPVRAFRVTERGYFGDPVVSIVRSETPARAKFVVWNSANEMGYKLEFKDFRVVRSPEYDAVKLIQDRPYSEDFTSSLLADGITQPTAATS